jgi:hypothetical protein
MVALERRHRTLCPDRFLGDLVELGGGHAGGNGLPNKTKSPGGDPPGLSHCLDLRL